MKTSFMALALSLFLASCSGGSDELPVPRQKQIIATTDNKDEIQEIFDNSSVVCGERACPDNVAKLTFYEMVDEEYQFGVCSGTLIRPGLILTNSHCVPDSLSYPGADCSGQIEVKFPGPEKNVVNTEKVECLRVRSVYREDRGEPDLALLEVGISRKSRTEVTIASSEPNVDEIVHAYTMNPNSNSPIGVIRKKNCKMLEENNLFENEHSGMGQLFTLGEQTTGSCTIIGGNSGSALFNDQNEVVGAVYAKIDGETLREALKNGGFTVKPYFRINRIGLGVNIQCMLPLTSHSDPNCPIQRNDNFESFVDFIEVLRTKAGLENTPTSELVVSVNKDLRFNVSEKPQSEILFGLDHAFISFDDFLAIEQESETLSRPLIKLFHTLRF